MCDLLDAAAALAGVPLLALVAVLTDTHEINPKAWKKEYSERRNAIIERSKRHTFSRTDFDAISAALAQLEGKGNRKAWEYVNKLYPREVLFLRLTNPSSEVYKPNLRADSNAINDLGTDAPDRARVSGWAYERDTKVRAAVLRRANGKCEYCGKQGFVKSDGTHYLECHHIIALAKDGADTLINVIALCPNDHREAHFGERYEELEIEMIATVKATLNT
jgi:hypothetical protein